MGYVSKYNRTFVSFINHKYAKYKTDFKTWDDYALWLYYRKCMCNTMLYYKMLEKDIWEYSDWQTGSPREREKMENNDDWKKLEKDRYELYQDENYVEFLKRNEWKKWGKREQNNQK